MDALRFSGLLINDSSCGASRYPSGAGDHLGKKARISSITSLGVACGFLKCGIALILCYIQVYFALLVFVTQKLSVRPSLKTHQSLTQTHDTTAAWRGIGAAILCAWDQRKLASSIPAVLSVFFYLGCIFVLHVTTPALFSVETFNATGPSVQVGTRGLPAYAWPGNFLRDANGLDKLSDYAMGSLEFFPSVVETAIAPGLSGGTLYDTLDLDTPMGIGNVTVNVTGFNISCGYMTDVKLRFDPGRGSLVDSQN
ncbi:hypothetical protein DFH08DRAFT_940089 [Mycena albidolilacea]|uniref:Uncharacterized protein n=1 Tax=Mycena albidolilacea TaxID=1033008 RepID=A0AAD7ELH3_9AGAR|nr:hypothetical protein DFH08DRAFT_940089 [Mycena albidolilacea]